MIDIPYYKTFAKIEEITKGYSGDKKYYVETMDGRRLLLRVTGIAMYDRKKVEFEMMKRVASLNIPMPQPVDFGVCNGGESCYQILSWCESKDAETVLPHLNEVEQYNLGIQAGQILKKIHTIPSPEIEEDWSIRFKKKIDSRFHNYRKEGLYFDGDERILEYTELHHKLIKNRPQFLRHNDYQHGNMMISNGKLIIIDFNDYDFGDPWEEFIFVVFNAQYYPRFSAGQINGYFDNEPPLEFWQLLAFYVVSFLPTYISWGTIFGKAEIAERIKLAQHILSICIDTQAPIPDWYLNEKYNQIY